MDFPDGSAGKESAAMQEAQETHFPSLGLEDLLELEMATHSSILAWKIPWTEEPGGLQSMGSQRVGHDWEHGTHIQPIYRIWYSPLFTEFGFP